MSLKRDTTAAAVDETAAAVEETAAAAASTNPEGKLSSSGLFTAPEDLTQLSFSR